MKTSKIIAVLVAVVAILWVLSGMLGGDGANDTGASSGSAAAEKSAAPKKMRVQVTPSTAQVYQQIVQVTGRTQAARTVNLRAETAGQIKTIYAQEGALVARGDVLAVIEPRERGARAEEARARTSQARTEYNAAKTLYERGFGSKARLDSARAGLDGALAGQRAAGIDLDKTKIRSPFAGRLSRQYIEVGDVSAIGSDLFTIVDLNPMEVAVYVSEQDVRGVTEGQAARITLFNGDNITGTVTYIAPAADERTRTFRILIEVENNDGTIKEGVTADVSLPAQRLNAHKISPAILGLDEDGKIGIKGVDMNNRVVFHSVKILNDTADYMWVGGLPEALDIITVGQNFVTTGQQVDAVKGEKTNPVKVSIPKLNNTSLKQDTDAQKTKASIK